MLMVILLCQGFYRLAGINGCIALMYTVARLHVLLFLTLFHGPRNRELGVE